MIAKIYKCFIASPSDTKAERDACDVVFASINSTLGEKFGFRIESIRWEKDGSPGFGSDGQDVINRQLRPSDHDFFIGIMWHRFGSPTQRAESGTEEEFTLAYKKWKECKTQRIQIFFNTSTPASLNDIDPHQLEKVKKFKQKVSECGGLYAEYSTLDAFTAKVRASIEKELLALCPPAATSPTDASIQTNLSDRLTQSLSMFSNQPVVWIDRILCRNGHLASTFDIPKEQVISVDNIIAENNSCIIKAPPQFGLTCLSHHMIKEAWSKRRQSWAYIDFDDISPKDVESRVQHDAKAFGRDTVDCIVVDSWSCDKNGAQKIIEVLHAGYPNSRLIVMQTTNEELTALSSVKIRADRQFEIYNLLALPRYEVRKAVKTYVARIVDDENTILNKLILDFDALNIHRTPMNCWTLLKVAESHTERNIVNRTQMLEKVLFVIFNLNKAPTYGALPDAKDCEHVLGYFCEELIRGSKLIFTKEYFIATIREYCAQKLVVIDVNVLFDILFENRILVPATQTAVRFRATFWVYYFAANRMHNNETFKTFILSDKRYAQYSEMIEFYTGIDRNRDDILHILCEELKITRELVDAKLGFNGVLNPLKLLRWTPSVADIDNMKKKLSDDVLKSSIPDSLKDQHSDKSYNHLKPYNQDIREFLQESSLLLYRHQLDAASRALRNSDYADVEIRKSLLREIVGGWTEISKVLFVLAPVLAHRGQASFGGYNFYLSEDFRIHEHDEKQMFLSILRANPCNVVQFCKDHLASDRIGPLLYDYLKSGPNVLARHLIISFLANVRPKDWKVSLEEYIIELDKNSFYLVDLFCQLGALYKFDYLNYEDEKHMCYLMKKCLAKHQLSINNPVGKMVDRISDNALPKRECVDNR